MFINEYVEDVDRKQIMLNDLLYEDGVLRFESDREAFVKHMRAGCPMIVCGFFE